MAPERTPPHSQFESGQPSVCQHTEHPGHAIGMTQLPGRKAAETSRQSSVRHSPARRNGTRCPPTNDQGLFAPLHWGIWIKAEAFPATAIVQRATDRPLKAAVDRTPF